MQEYGDSGRNATSHEGADCAVTVACVHSLTSVRIVTEIRQWGPVKWSNDDWVQGYKTSRSWVTTPWPPEIDPFTTNGEVDIAMVEKSHAEGEYPREIKEVKVKKYLSINKRLQKEHCPQAHLLHKVWKHMGNCGLSSMAEMSSRLQKVLPSLAKKGPLSEGDMWFVLHSERFKNLVTFFYILVN